MIKKTIRIDFFIEGKISLPYKKTTKAKMKSVLTDACDYLKLRDISVSVIVCDNKYIHNINKEYRKKDKATDVISFSYRENPFPDTGIKPEPLGDIYISLEKAEENAVEYEVGLFDEVRRLLVHGLLHLIGYDHERSEKDEKIMQEKEEEIFLHLVHD